MEANFICTSCGEPCEESEINEDGECPTCVENVSPEAGALREDEDDTPYCVSCNGTGEGRVDGSRCAACGGSGLDEREDPDDFDPPDSDDNFTTDRDYGPWGYEG